MNVTDKLSFMKDDKKVLGAGGYFLDRDDGGSMCYSGIWQDGKVIALVLDECCDSDVVRERGEMFVKAVNAHDKLVEALKLAQKTMEKFETPGHGGSYPARYTYANAFAVIDAALAAAGEQV